MALLVARRSAVEMTGDTERQVVSLGATCPEQLDTKLRGKTTVQIVDTCSRWCPSGDPGLLGLAMRYVLARRSTTCAPRPEPTSVALRIS